MAGAAAGLNEVLGALEGERFIHLDGANTWQGAYRAAKKHVRSRSLILAMNDPNALGALAAFRDQGREEQCAVVGQGATLDARMELRRRSTRLIGSVAYFPERYGEALLRLALDILQNKPLPPALYTRHRLITQVNVDRIYPKDKSA
jgi:ribose transport system substrate-binding protein